MKRLLLPLLLALAFAPPAHADPPSEVRLAACGSSLEQSLRTMAVEGRMRTVDGARKLQMRFELQILTPARPRWTRVSAPGFGDWNTAEPAPKRYAFEKRVEALTAPARYRMVVRFRWLGAGDRQIASGKRVSATCTQEDLRPDLAPERVSVGPSAGKGMRRYVVAVKNEGGSEPASFSVALEINGVRLAPAAVAAGLEPDARTELTFSAPACRPGTRLEVLVDPTDAVDESDKANNRLSRPCPNA